MPELDAAFLSPPSSGPTRSCGISAGWNSRTSSRRASSRPCADRRAPPAAAAVASNPRKLIGRSRPRTVTATRASHAARAARTAAGRDAARTMPPLRGVDHGRGARFFTTVLLLEVREHASQEHDHALALRPRRCAPLAAARALVRDFELEARERRRVVVRGLFRGVLMREDVPVILGADGHAGSFRSAPGAPLGHGVADLPQVGRDLLFLPLAPVVIPLVTSADLHPRITLALVLLEFVVGNGEIAFGLGGRLFRRAALYAHGTP